MKAFISFEDTDKGVAVKVEEVDGLLESEEEIPDSIRLAAMWCQTIVNYYLRTPEDDEELLTIH